MMVGIKRLIKRKLKEHTPRSFHARAPFRSSFSYARRDSSVLNRLCVAYGTDKGGYFARGQGPFPHESHTYADIYELLFAHCRHHVSAVLECGIGTNNPTLKSNMGETGQPGASLRCWRDYFPNAQIVGVDIDDRILFEEERITTLQLDQTDPVSVRAVVGQLEHLRFDLMIDDGLHTFAAARTLYENSKTLLKRTGVYVVEDVLPRDFDEFARYFENSQCDVRFVFAAKPGPIGRTSGMVIISPTD
jgi:hypothetical protein